MPRLQQHYLVITALGAKCWARNLPYIMLLSGGWNAIAQLESTLPLKGAELDLLIVMKRTTAQEQPATPTTLWVRVEVDDSPYLIECYTDLFDSHQMTLAELASKTQPAERAIPAPADALDDPARSGRASGSAD